MGRKTEQRNIKKTHPTFAPISQTEHVSTRKVVFSKK